MKISIEGLSQQYAITLRKSRVVKGKEQTIKIDCTDLVIIRWFIDFYPRMKKMTIDGEEYGWITYNKIAEDLPIIDISKKSFADRLRKLVEFGILKHKLVKEGGTFCLYTFGSNYINLVKDSTSNDNGCSSNSQGGAGQPDTPMQFDRNRGCRSTG
jgi:hypothetical protein